MDKTVCFLAHDAAPSQCFNRLDEEIRTKFSGIKTVKFLGNGASIHDQHNEIAKAVREANLLLLGMSSSSQFAESELFGGSIAKESRIPYGFYSDMPFAPYRGRDGGWFSDLAKEASFLFGLLPNSTEEVVAMYPKARCVRTGNPLRDAMAFPRFSRKEIRDRLSIGSEQKLILASGDKLAVCNGLIWMLLIEALCDSDIDPVVILSPHPGDPVLRAVSSSSGKAIGFYEDIVKYSPIPTLLNHEKRIDTLDIVTAADLIVEFTGSASVCAAYQRVPVIHLTPRIMMEKLVDEMGEARIETLELGAAVQAPTISVSGLSQIIKELLDPATSISRKLRNAQERAYPIPVGSNGSLNALLSEISEQLAL